MKTSPKHVVFHASSVLTATYSFATEAAGSPGFYEGKAIVHFGSRQIATVAHARGAERAVCLALIAAAQEGLAAFPAAFPEPGPVCTTCGDVRLPPDWWCPACDQRGPMDRLASHSGDGDAD